MRLRLTLDAVVLFDLAMFEPETAEDPAEGIQGAPPQASTEIGFAALLGWAPDRRGDEG